MSTVLKPIITEAGLQAVFNAQQNGLNAQITHVALGDSGYDPTQASTALKSEQHRIAVASGERVSGNQIHMSVIEDSDKAYWVKEVGFFLEDGTLFALHAQSEGVLAYKSPDVDLLLAFDLALTGVPADSVNIIDQGADLNLLVAPELAKMGAAQISNMYRYLKQKFALMDAGLIS